MDVIEQITKDRENLLEGLQRMLVQVEQQKGAVQYCDSILERIQGEQNGTQGVPGKEPPGGE